jgi:F0F1-type ATP synthase assembly protein I
MPDKKEDNVMQMVGRYLSIAMMIPVATFVGYVIGYFLDKYFGTGFLKIVFLLAGIAAGFIELFRELNKDTKEP